MPYATRTEASPGSIATSRFPVRTCLALAMWIAAASPSFADVVLNEFVASNSTGLIDEDGDRPDWIEIHNSGGEPVDLLGWGLTDNLANPFKWVFPSRLLGAGEFLVVFASSKNRVGATLHTSFAISAGGEALALTTPEGITANTAPATVLPADIACGRQPDDDGDWFFFDDPTPGGPNGSGGYRSSGPVEFLSEGGWYPLGVTLELAADGASDIHYTLDGSTPDADSPLYTAPLVLSDRSDDPNHFAEIPSSPPEFWLPPAGPVRKANVVRAIAVRPGAGRGPVATHTFFVGEAPAGAASLPVVSIAVDEDDFWDYERGIYVPGRIYDDSFDPLLLPHQRPANYTQTGDEWERRGALELFETDATAVLRQEVGLRINGHATRVVRRKSLRLYARSEYGASSFEHEVFPGNPVTSFKRLVLRNSGNDWALTLFRDAMMQGLVADTGLATQAARQTVVFVNGEYWGIYDIRERLDKYYLASHYGVDPEAVDMLGGVGEVEEGDREHFFALRSYILDHDLSDPGVYAWVPTQMDVDDYITYFAAEIYFRNTDWPQSNIDYWRPRTPEGRWRWLLADTDFGFGLTGSPEAWTHDSLRRVVEDSRINARMFQALLASRTFRDRFLLHYADLLNSVFLPARVLDRIDETAALLAPAIAEHIHRWRAPESVAAWEAEVEVLCDFAVNRPAPLRDQAVDLFELGGTATIRVQHEHPARGRLEVGTLDLDGAAFPWSGVYFRGVPLPLRGVATDGYRFDGFKGLHTNEEGDAVLTPEADTELVALFVPKDAPLGCGDAELLDSEQCEADGGDAACPGRCNELCTCESACGVPLTGGSEPKAADALAVLRGAVGSYACALDVCDVDGSGEVTASDALLVLGRAVGIAAPLVCDGETELAEFEFASEGSDETRGLSIACDPGTAFSTDR